MQMSVSNSWALPTYLHANDGVDEEEHGDEQTDVGQRLEGLYEGPEEDANGVPLPKELDQSGRTKEPQKADGDKVELLCREKTERLIIAYR